MNYLNQFHLRAGHQSTAPIEHLSAEENVLTWNIGQMVQPGPGLDGSRSTAQAESTLTLCTLNWHL
jgi:hypothetical protein